MKDWMLRCISHILLCALAVALGGFALAGCDEGPDISAADAYFANHPYVTNAPPVVTNVPSSGTNTPPPSSTNTPTSTALAVSPIDQTLTYDSELFNLVASGGHPPYNWRVFDVTLGSIVYTSTVQHAQAVYRRDAAGDNFVILQDHSGSEVQCHITQPVIP